MRALTPNGYFCASAAAAFARLSLAPLFSVEPPSCVCARVGKEDEEEEGGGGRRRNPPLFRLFRAFFWEVLFEDFRGRKEEEKRAASSTRYPVNSLEKGGRKREGEPKLGRSDNPTAIFQAGAACASTRFHPARRESRSPSRINKAIVLSTRGESPNI